MTSLVFLPTSTMRPIVKEIKINKCLMTTKLNKLTIWKLTWLIILCKIIISSLLSSSIRGQTELKPQSQETNQTDHMDHNLV